MIIKLQRQLGNKWAVIAKHLPGRTDNAVKNRFNSTISRRIRQDPSPVPVTPKKSGRKRKLDDEADMTDGSGSEQPPKKRRTSRSRSKNGDMDDEDDEETRDSEYFEVDQDNQQIQRIGSMSGSSSNTDSSLSHNEQYSEAPDNANSSEDLSRNPLHAILSSESIFVRRQLPSRAAKSARTNQRVYDESIYPATSKSSLSFVGSGSDLNNTSMEMTSISVSSRSPTPSTPPTPSSPNNSSSPSHNGGSSPTPSSPNQNDQRDSSFFNNPGQPPTFFSFSENPIPGMVGSSVSLHNNLAINGHSGSAFSTPKRSAPSILKKRSSLLNGSNGGSAFSPAQPSSLKRARVHTVYSPNNDSTTQSASSPLSPGQSALTTLTSSGNNGAPSLVSVVGNNEQTKSASLSFTTSAGSNGVVCLPVEGTESRMLKEEKDQTVCDKADEKLPLLVGFVAESPVSFTTSLSSPLPLIMTPTPIFDHSPTPTTTTSSSEVTPVSSTSPSPMPFVVHSDFRNEQLASTSYSQPTQSSMMGTSTSSISSLLEIVSSKHDLKVDAENNIKAPSVSIDAAKKQDLILSSDNIQDVANVFQSGDSRVPVKAEDQQLNENKVFQLPISSVVDTNCDHTSNLMNSSSSAAVNPPKKNMSALLQRCQNLFFSKQNKTIKQHFQEQQLHQQEVIQQ
eukprot:TRINITY_DN1808_c0_g1_i1.p1 TRINITY_DN1808_c0_g1~~TRINITY_DN1808_c0_g1_i1.p1  ORF type:complete len:676 (-),score=181.30 TRINITY_DN1808_c0_g1_i1:501-2528(-)